MAFRKQTVEALTRVIRHRSDARVLRGHQVRVPQGFLEVERVWLVDPSRLIPISLEVLAAGLPPLVPAPHERLDVASIQRLPATIEFAHAEAIQRNKPRFTRIALQKFCWGHVRT